MFIKKESYNRLGNFKTFNIIYRIFNKIKQANGHKSSTDWIQWKMQWHSCCEQKCLSDLPYARFQFRFPFLHFCISIYHTQPPHPATLFDYFSCFVTAWWTFDFKVNRVFVHTHNTQPTHSNPPLDSSKLTVHLILPAGPVVLRFSAVLPIFSSLNALQHFGDLPQQTKCTWPYRGKKYHPLCIVKILTKLKEKYLCYNIFLKYIYWDNLYLLGR